jgi:hypothetical protein
MAFRHWNFAASVPFARVFAGATIVTRFAATLPLALVLPFATVLGCRRTTAMAFAGVLTGAAAVTGLAAALPFAFVHALTGMLVATFGCSVPSHYTVNLCAGKNPGYSAKQ